MAEINKSDEEYNLMSPRERKLYELRLKVNRARKDNHNEVVAEDRRRHEVQTGESKAKAKKEYEDLKKAEKEVLLRNGLDPEKEKLMQTTAAEAEWKEKKRKKGAAGASFGWDQYNPDAQYNAYKKRVKEVKTNLDEYSEQKSSLGEDEFYRDSNYLGYGQSSDVAPEGVDKMVKELETNIIKRKNFSRRREHHDEAYVTYINDRNKVFNQKISRAYDKYTVEIKQNLERGTAI